MAPQPLRVGIFATPVGSNGGIARWISETSQLFARADIETQLLIGRQPTVRLSDPWLAAASVAVTKRSLGAQLRRLRRWLATNELDVLITALPQAALLASLARPSIPLVATIHGDPPAGVRGRLYSTTMRRLAADANTQVVTVAGGLGTRWGLPHSTTIANAVAVPAPTAPRSKTPKSVAYVGRLEPEKGIDHMLELVKANAAFTFHIAGDGRLRPDVESAARQLTNLKYHGWVRDVPEFLAPMESVVFPAPSEGMPYALIEALWADCLPIIRSADLAAELGLDGHTVLAERTDLAPIVDHLEFVDIDALRKPFSADQASASWATLVSTIAGSRR